MPHLRALVKEVRLRRFLIFPLSWILNQVRFKLTLRCVGIGENGIQRQLKPTVLGNWEKGFTLKPPKMMQSESNGAK